MWVINIQTVADNESKKCLFALVLHKKQSITINFPKMMNKTRETIKQILILCLC